jgi:hypothetical protein
VIVSDNIKLLFSYLLALIVVVGGGLMLYAIRLDPTESGSETLSLAVVGFIGLALGFVFNRESATQATRASQSSNAAGVASQNGDRLHDVDAAARRHGV